MKMISAANCGNVVSHGSACWMAVFRESIDSHRAVQSRAGVISGEDLFHGVDVDAFVADLWASVELYGSMELQLMLVSCNVVTIDSVRDAAGCQVLSVRYDQTTFPSGLTGRWVDKVFTEPRKRGRAVAVA